jgi:hypothetical protein
MKGIEKVAGRENIDWVKKRKAKNDSIIQVITYLLGNFTL